MYMSTSDAARILGCDNNTIFRLEKKGLLTRGVRVSPRKVEWLTEEIEAFADKYELPRDDYVLSRTDASRLMGLSRETVSRMVADGTLSAVRRRGRLLFSESDVAKAIDERGKKKRLDWLEAAKLVGLHWWDLKDLMNCGAFPRHDYRQRFLRGEVLGWYENYLLTGSLTGDPALDARRFPNLKPVLNETAA